MFDTNNIDALYNKFQNDLDIKIKMPKIITNFNSHNQEMARIQSITDDVYELAIGEIFFESNINSQYLESVLYHEFTHILDDKMFYTKIASKEKQNLLFPYTEFHATKVEFLYNSGLLQNRNKRINKLSLIPDVYKTVPLKDFVAIQYKEFTDRYDLLKESSSMQDIQYLIYALVYNLAHLSVINEYSIDIEQPDFSAIERHQELLNVLEETKTDEDCTKASILANEIILKIAIDIWGMDNLPFL